MEELTRQTRLPPYLMYPRFLLELDVSETAKLVYILLLDRLRLSMTGSGWTDEQGHVYVYYPIAALARDSRRARTTVKDALGELQRLGLIRRFHQGRGMANRLFLRVIDGPENRPPEGRKSDSQTAGKPAPNKNNLERKKLPRTRDYDCQEDESL